MARDSEAVARELLAVRCRRGDRAALEELVRAFEGRLFYFVRGLVPHEADAWDVLQKTWLRVLNGIASLDDPARLVPWLYRVARNAALSHARRPPEPTELPADLAGPEPDADEFADAEAVHRGLQRLSAAHREVLTLFFLEGLGVDDTAAVVGVPPGTVKSRLHHARLALRKVLDGGLS